MNGMAMSFPPLNAERLWSRVETLSRYTLPDQPWTRRAFSPLFLEARDWLRGEAPFRRCSSKRATGCAVNSRPRAWPRAWTPAAT